MILVFQSIWSWIQSKLILNTMMLKLKFQYFGHLIQRANSLVKILIQGKIEGRRREWQWMKWLDGITYSMDMSLSKLQETVKDREAWHDTVQGKEKSRTQLSEWTTINAAFYCNVWKLSECLQNTAEVSFLFKEIDVFLIFHNFKNINTHSKVCILYCEGLSFKIY